MVTAVAVNEFPFLIFLIQLLLIYIVTLKSNLDGGFYKEKKFFFFRRWFCLIILFIIFCARIVAQGGMTLDGLVVLS